MTSRALTRYLLAMIALAACLFGGSCLGNRHYLVDGDEFMAAMPIGVNSAASGRFLGAHDGRVYLHLWNGMPWLLGGGDHVYSCAVADLPAAARAAVERGLAPWPGPAPETKPRGPDAR